MVTILLFFSCLTKPNNEIPSDWYHSINFSSQFGKFVIAPNHYLYRNPIFLNSNVSTRWHDVYPEPVQNPLFLSQIEFLLLEISQDELETAFEAQN